MRNHQHDIKINLGSGKRRFLGYYNIDIRELKEVDLVCDLNKGIPFKNNTVSEVKAYHVLEHLVDLKMIAEEIYRVCKNKAKVQIISPYYASIGAFKDPTHVSFITEETFYYFNENERKKRQLADTNEIKANFLINEISYLWSSALIGVLPFKHILRRYFWNIARTIFIELEVKK